jgi:hypothetical protein
VNEGSTLNTVGSRSPNKSVRCSFICPDILPLAFEWIPNRSSVHCVGNVASAVACIPGNPTLFNCSCACAANLSATFRATPAGFCAVTSTSFANSLIPPSPTLLDPILPYAVLPRSSTSNGRSPNPTDVGTPILKSTDGRCASPAALVVI